MSTKRGGMRALGLFGGGVWPFGLCTSGVCTVIFGLICFCHYIESFTYQDLLCIIDPYISNNVI